MANATLRGKRGEGYLSRSIEAVNCYDAHTYYACCVMATRIAALETKTASMSVVAANDSSNTSNLIIGYNTLRGSASTTRTGSHNLIVGDQNNYTSYGGVVFGLQNTISGERQQLQRVGRRYEQGARPRRQRVGRL